MGNSFGAAQNPTQKTPITTSDIPKPPAPEFTVILYDSSYDIPATTTTDPFTGQQIITPSRHINQRTIEIRIKNIPFTAKQLDYNSTYDTEFLYNIRWKPHFASEKDWLTLFGPYYQYLARSSATETVYKINMTRLSDGSFDVPEWSRYIPANAQLDFQVQAMIGGPNNAWSFLGQKSDWSQAQTITIGQSTPTKTPNTPLSEDSTTLTPINFDPIRTDLYGLSWGMIAIIVLLSIIAVLLVLIMLLQKRKKTTFWKVNLLSKQKSKQ